MRRSCVRSSLSSDTRKDMYAGRVACCSLVSYVEYAARVLLSLEKDETDRLTDAGYTRPA